MREEVTKHTLFLYAGDYAALRDRYPSIGAAVIIRKLVRQHLRKLDKQPVETPKEELDL